MFPLLIWQLFSVTASVSRIPDRGTQPHFLVFSQTISFYNLFSFPPSSHKFCYYPLGMTHKSALIAQGSVPSLLAPICPLCQRIPKNWWSSSFLARGVNVASSSLETQIKRKGQKSDTNICQNSQVLYLPFQVENRSWNKIEMHNVTKLFLNQNSITFQEKPVTVF